MKPLDPNFTPDRIAEQKAAFARSGGKVQSTPFGVMKESIGGREYMNATAARVFEERELTMKQVRQNWKERNGD